MSSILSYSKIIQLLFAFNTKQVSKVDNYCFDYCLSDNEGYIIENKLSFLQRLKFISKLVLESNRASARLRETLQKGECYLGPFKGEYGHFLAHNLPFISYLHSKGVKINYCGMDLHRALLIDENGQSLFKSYTPLRDFFAEVPPNSNMITPPSDVQKVILQFEKQAVESGLPFWNIGNDYYYWFIHRFWIKGHTHLYNLSEVYQSKQENAVCIFPRGKGAAVSHNNGGPWDYEEMIEKLSEIFDKIYVVGHPSQSLQLKGNAQTEFRITADNAKILEACANSNLIITQHSGVNNLGEYLQKQVLIIYNGGTQVTDIGSMNNTLYFRKMLQEKIPLKFAFTMNEIITSAKKFAKQYAA